MLPSAKPILGKKYFKKYKKTPPPPCRRRHHTTDPKNKRMKCSPSTETFTQTEFRKKNSLIVYKEKKLDSIGSESQLHM